MNKLGLNTSFSVLESVDCYRNAPLEEAVLSQDTGKIVELVKNGASINGASSCGLSPLELAVKTGNLLVLKAILDHLPTDSLLLPAVYDGLVLAIKNNDARMVSLFTEKRVHLNRHSLFSPELMDVAIGGNHVEITNLLIQAGAPLHTHSQMDTPLNLALHTGNLKLVELLLKHGENPDIPQTRRKNTPIEEAVEKHHLEALKMMLAASKDLEAPLRMAILTNNMAAARIIMNSTSISFPKAIDLALAAQNIRMAAFFYAMETYELKSVLETEESFINRCAEVLGSQFDFSLQDEEEREAVFECIYTELDNARIELIKLNPASSGPILQLIEAIDRDEVQLVKELKQVLEEQLNSHFGSLFLSRCVTQYRCRVLEFLLESYPDLRAEFKSHHPCFVSSPILGRLYEKYSVKKTYDLKTLDYVNQTRHLRNVWSIDQEEFTKVSIPLGETSSSTYVWFQDAVRNFLYYNKALSGSAKEAIQESVEFSVSLNCSNVAYDFEKLSKRIQYNGAAFHRSGWEGHYTSTYWDALEVKGELHRFMIQVNRGNRGLLEDEHSPQGAVYEYKKIPDVKSIEAFWSKRNESGFYFNNSIHGEVVSTLFNSNFFEDQKIGNCAWSNLKPVFFYMVQFQIMRQMSKENPLWSLQDLFVHSAELSKSIYKEFDCYVREEALKTYLSRKGEYKNDPQFLGKIKLLTEMKLEKLEKGERREYYQRIANLLSKEWTEIPTSEEQLSLAIRHHSASFFKSLLGSGASIQKGDLPGLLHPKNHEFVEIALKTKKISKI